MILAWAGCGPRECGSRQQGWVGSARGLHLGAAGARGRRARGPALHGDARVVGVRVAPRRLVEDRLRQLGERALDIDVRLRWRLHEPYAVLARYLFHNKPAL